MTLRNASVALALVSPAVAVAEMASLESIKRGDPEQSYQYARCAAFYLANVEWAGQTIGEEVFEASKKSVEDLLLIATMVRLSNSDGNRGTAHVAETVNLDTREIADLYLENYRRSYALRGTAWEANPIWESDAETCKPVAEAASQIANELGDQK
ncbi:MAG: hypothetical protein QNI90_05190 [Dinoroseobacter sp.]|nr:hypothetical protein [Dinoroseobacter sp.]